MLSLYSHFSVASILPSVGLALSFGLGQGLSPEKWPHQHVTLIASWKHILKMAQLAPLGSR